MHTIGRIDLIKISTMESQMFSIIGEASKLSEGTRFDIDSHKICALMCFNQSRDSVLSGHGLGKHFEDAMDHVKRIDDIVRGV